MFSVLVFVKSCKKDVSWILTFPKDRYGQNCQNMSFGVAYKFTVLKNRSISRKNTMIRLVTFLPFSVITADQMVANESFVDSWFEKSRDSMLDNVESKIASLELDLSQAKTRSGQIEAFDRLNDFRALREVKRMVNWLQRNPGFGRYCYYGCYCLDWLHRLEGPENAPKGSGDPVDSVDSACKVQTECYWCAKNDVYEVHHESFSGFECTPDVGYGLKEK